MDQLVRSAFDTLGIAPTDDGRVMRAAFLRLARIYHPDRFVGMPDDVRAEAEKRMKDATIAYELLRAQTVNKTAKPDGAVFDEVEYREAARKYRETIERKKTQELRDRDRWSRWEEVERASRVRRARDADVAAKIASEFAERQRFNGSGSHTEPRPVPHRSDSLGDRLDAARRGETAPLVRRRPATE
jgi:curved DNA-binding protein CbpA